MNLNSEKLSGFILQKDVYTTNILYENNLIPVRNIKHILPFRPKSGRIPQDPTPCVKIIKQIGPIHNIPKLEDFFIFKKNFRTKKLKKRKLKFPLPKLRLRPISSNDFYKHLRNKNLKTRNIEDDLNITSKHGKKIYYSFRNAFDNSDREKYKEKYVKVGYGNIFNNDDKKFDEFFDYGFHMNKENEDFMTKPKRIKSATKLKVRVGIFPQKKIYQKDNTFKTQIDFNLLYANNKFSSGANTAKFQSKSNNNINLS